MNYLNANQTTFQPTAIFTPLSEEKDGSSVNMKMISIFVIIGICVIAGCITMAYCHFLRKRNERRMDKADDIVRNQNTLGLSPSVNVDPIDDSETQTAKL